MFKILFFKHILQHNSLLKDIFLHEFEEKKPSKCIKQVKKYMLDLQFTPHTIEFSKHTGLQRPYKENRETHIAEFLLFNNNINQDIIIRNRDELQKLWQHRHLIMLQEMLKY